MTVEERQLNTLILVSIGKLYSEQSTYLTKELRMNTKADFNRSVNGIDTFVNVIEKRLTENECEFLQQMTDCLNVALSEMRKELFKDKL